MLQNETIEEANSQARGEVLLGLMQVGAFLLGAGVVAGFWYGLHLLIS